MLCENLLVKKAWPSRGSRKNFSARNLFCHPFPTSSALPPFFVTSVSLTCSFPLPPSSARSLILSSHASHLSSLFSLPLPTLFISFSESFFPHSSALFLTYESFILLSLILLSYLPFPLSLLFRFTQFFSP